MEDVAVATWRTTYDNWRIKDNMAMVVIKGMLCGQYLTYILHCMMLKAVWDAILSRLKTQDLGLAVHNTKQLLYNHLYLRGPIEEYLRHFTVMNKQLTCISKVLPDLDVVHWMLENLLKDDPSWKSVISSFHMVNLDPDLVTSFQVSVAICNHYNQLMALPTHSSSAYITPTFESAVAAHHGCPTNSLNCPYCNGCKKLGHMVDSCFDLILAEIGKLNTCLPCSLQLSSPPKFKRANVVSDGISGMSHGIMDDRDNPDEEDDIVLLTMALKRGEVFVSMSLNTVVADCFHLCSTNGQNLMGSPIIHDESYEKTEAMSMTQPENMTENTGKVWKKVCVQQGKKGSHYTSTII